MPGSIEMLDIVNTLMLCDLTFNSFRTVRDEIYVFIHILISMMVTIRWLENVGGHVLMMVKPSGGHEVSLEDRAPPGDGTFLFSIICNRGLNLLLNFCTTVFQYFFICSPPGCCYLTVPATKELVQCSAQFVSALKVCVYEACYVVGVLLKL